MGSLRTDSINGQQNADKMAVARKKVQPKKENSIMRKGLDNMKAISEAHNKALHSKNLPEKVAAKFLSTLGIVAIPFFIADVTTFIDKKVNEKKK